jgi:hypothetical protein
VCCVVCVRWCGCCQHTACPGQPQGGSEWVSRPLHATC